MTFTVRAADHTGITVTDLERSVAFWRDVLGFELARRGRLGGAFAAGVTGVAGADIETAIMVAPGGHRVELLQYHAPGDRSVLRPRPSDVGSVHLALTVDDIDAVLAAVTAAGWSAAGAPQTMAEGPRAGSRFAYATDEDGTLLEFIQVSPTA